LHLTSNKWVAIALMRNIILHLLNHTATFHI